MGRRMGRSAEEWMKLMQPETLADAQRNYPDVFGNKPPVNGVRIKPVKQVDRLRWKDEDEFMYAVFEHLAVKAVQQPAYKLAYHPANENAHRRPGVVGGIPDIHWPVARGKYIGLWVELKVNDNTLHETQREMIYQLRNAGHSVHIVWDDLDEVINIFTDYERGI